eukprot:360527-Chlamydomonas_euryale.AAC.8
MPACCMACCANHPQHAACETSALTPDTLHGVLLPSSPSMLHGVLLPSTHSMLHGLLLPSTHGMLLGICYCLAGKSC